jgi:tetratricopeptide (TPR) repeat protein
MQESRTLKCALFFNLLVTALVLLLFSSSCIAQHPGDIEKAFAENNFLKSFKLFFQLEERNRTARLYRIAAESAWGLGLQTEAIKILDELFVTIRGSREDKNWALLTKAIILFQEKKFKDCASVLDSLEQRIMQSDSLQGELLGLRAQLYAIQNQKNVAIDLLKEAIVLVNDKSKEDFALVLGTLLFKLGKFDESKLYLTQVPPNHEEAFRATKLLTEISLNQGKLEEANLWIEEGLRVHPQDLYDSYTDFMKVKIAIATNDKNKVKKLVNRIQEKYPNTDHWKSLIDAKYEIFLARDNASTN